MPADKRRGTQEPVAQEGLDWGNVLGDIGTGAATAMFGPLGGGVADIAKNVVGGVLPSLFGGAKPIEYKPTYGDIYSYDPYAFAPGEENIYNRELLESKKGAYGQEKGQQSAFAEAMNKRGLGRSSMFSTGSGKISSDMQTALQNAIANQNKNLQGLHENRAGTQRLMKHQWNLGPGYQGQADTNTVEANRQASINTAANAYTNPYLNPKKQQPQGGNF